MILFAFKTQDAMAGVLAAAPGFQLGRFQTARFENGEVYIRLETRVAGEDCAILGDIGPPDEQMLFTLLLAHTLHKEGARRVSAILPYLAYARHDKDKPGESLATQWIGALMRASSLDSLITVDIHSERAKGLLALPVVSLSPAAIFAAAIRQWAHSEATIVAPDDGARDRCRAVQLALGRSAGVIPYFEKKRTAAGIVHAGLVGTTSAEVVIVDDILDTGTTLVSACEKLREAGVRTIDVMVTHGLFTGDRWRKLWQLGVERIFCTDSVPLRPALAESRIVQLSVAPLIEAHLSAIVAVTSGTQSAS